MLQPRKKPKNSIIRSGFIQFGDWSKDDESSMRIRVDQILNYYLHVKDKSYFIRITISGDRDLNLNFKKNIDKAKEAMTYLDEKLGVEKLKI